MLVRLSRIEAELGALRRCLHELRAHVPAVPQNAVADLTDDLAAILAASPVSAANVTTWANATRWANLADCHKCADRYGALARNLSECPAEWPEGAHTPVTNPHATRAQIAAAEQCIRRLTRRRMNRR